MPPSLFYVNQRYISETEPELGLGIVTATDRRFVTIDFPAQKETRTYVAESAPIRRVTFGIGDSILDQKNSELRITGIIEDPVSHTISYVCTSVQIHESAIADTVASVAPLDRFKKGILDPLTDFDTRYDLLRLHAQAQSSPICGYIGCRIDLLAHQLSIVHSVCRQRVVRALLADETGLGKTIEAGLILSRLHALGRVNRALVLVPESLVHQWFVELLRRFTITARIIADEDLKAMAQSNVFLEDQIIIANVNLLDNAAAALHITHAPWDLIIVDEAHHLKHDSPPFTALKTIAEKECGIILLSATPEQLGREDHFYRLQLLDPQRYPNYTSYEKESVQLRKISQLIDAHLSALPDSGSKTDPKDVLITIPPNTLSHQPSPVTCTISELIDRFGTGRILFRNTRRNVAGFPVRIVDSTPLPGSLSISKALYKEMAADLNHEAGTEFLPVDPRVEWLAQLLKKYPQDKFLIIGTTRTKAESLKELLQKKIKVEAALFHESMTILQRDRNAAWFARPDGARLLICSESGSEGRNFQFCQHLVLIDLPADPELLEQRIGRLDRIGQKEKIVIHVPCIADSPLEVLCRWYHEALNAFAGNIPAAGRVFNDVRPALFDLLNNRVKPSDRTAAIDSLVAQSGKLCKKHAKAITDSRDRLLELASCQTAVASRLIEAIGEADKKQTAEHIMDRLFKRYGVLAEDAGHHTLALNTECVTDHAFPLPRREQPIITYDRVTALSREEVEFLTIDHPVVKDGLELYLASGNGTTAAAGWEQTRGPQLLLEMIFIVECLAPQQLNSKRFLPPVPLKIIVDQTGNDMTDMFEKTQLIKKCRPIQPGRTFDTECKQMVDAATVFAVKRMQPMVATAIRNIEKFYVKEIERCRLLIAKGYKAATVDEQILVEQQAGLIQHARQTRARLDALRLIVNNAVDRTEKTIEADTVVYDDFDSIDDQ